MTKKSFEEGTFICTVSAPALWPVHSDVIFGNVALLDLDAKFYYSPDKRIAITLVGRDGSATSLSSCPIEFDPIGHSDKRLFRMAVTWSARKVEAIAAGGALIAGTGCAMQATIPLKGEAELKPVDLPDGEVMFQLCEGNIGPVPAVFAEARREVERAARLARRLREGKNLADLSDDWKSYLDAAVKAKNKIEKATLALAPDEQAARSWTGRFEKKIAQSDLWSYILQARNADNHGLRAILAQRDGSLSFSSDGVTHIETIKVTAEGIEFTYSGYPPNVTVIPARVEALPVVNRGVICNPPEGRAALHVLAHGGLAFLELWLIDTVAKFG